MPKVLLMTSQPHLQHLLERRLRQEGFDVVLGSWQDDGLLAGEAPPDLIVIGQGDEEHLRQVARRGGLGSVPVILLTTSETAQDDTLPDMAQLKMPFRPSQLIALARKAVSAL